MKKLLFVLIILGGGYTYYQYSGNNQEALSVSELINSNDATSEKAVEVTGRIARNFKLYYSIYELVDIDTGESIMVTSKSNLPKIGSVITRKLKRTDVVTINDKTFSLYEESE